MAWHGAAGQGLAGMIRVELGEPIYTPANVQWPWKARGIDLEGRSRAPLLDACRKLKRMGVPGKQRVGLFRERSTPDLFCTVGIGAGLSIDEYHTTFAKYKPHPIGVGLPWPGKPDN
jgi:hypothetical protein